jgi:hypothetical protein
LSPGAALPLPGDPPHVGAYRTGYSELFAGRTPPEAARLAERTLPLQRQVIDERAAAVQAAKDALLAIEEDYRNGRAKATAVPACAHELFEQRRAFIRSVCDYNRNIAEYGFTVAQPAAGPERLVEMLIGSAAQGGVPSIPGTPAAAPATPGNRWLVQPTGANEPTLAPPRKDPKNDRAPAAPRNNANGSKQSPAPPDQGSRLTPTGENEPALAPPGGDRQSSLPPTPMTSRTANKLLAISEGNASQDRADSVNGTTAAVAPLYAALADVSPAMLAKQLTAALGCDRALPKQGALVSLSDCLFRDASGGRLATIEAYWRVGCRAAQYRVLAEQAELFQAVAPIALERRGAPCGATDMLRLRSAQLAARAAMREAEVALVESQYSLALRIGTAAEVAWPLPSTVPHSGAYLLKFEAQPSSWTERWPVRRLAATMPGLCENVRQRAAAVVDADAVRAATIDKYSAGGAAIDRVIGSITEETEHGMAFLDCLAEYNGAIAEYALAVLPPDIPADKLVGALVVKP